MNKIKIFDFVIKKAKWFLTSQVFLKSFLYNLVRYTPIFTARTNKVAAIAWEVIDARNGSCPMLKK